MLIVLVYFRDTQENIVSKFVKDAPVMQRNIHHYQTSNITNWIPSRTISVNEDVLRKNIVNDNQKENAAAIDGDPHQVLDLSVDPVAVDIDYWIFQLQRPFSTVWHRDIFAVFFKMYWVAIWLLLLDILSGLLCKRWFQSILDFNQL